MSLREQPRIVAVDDDPQIGRVVARTLERAGMEVISFQSAEPLFAALDGELGELDLVLTDLHMPKLDGMAVLEHLKTQRPRVPVLFLTGEQTVGAAVRAMQHGAYDYLVKPADLGDRLVASVHRALEHRRLLERNRVLEGKLTVAERHAGIVGRSPAMREVHELIGSVAKVDVTVLVLGESGTGKELVARAIHDESLRGGKPFVAINCGALTESLVESELFGHVRGAFTGAGEARRGLFEEASGSTLFLDEVAELPLSTQVKLLRVLQEGEVRPIGSNEVRKVDVRVIAATHRDLPQAVRDGTFREDLFYRLNVVSLVIPPLRERPDDVIELAHHFARKHGERLGKTEVRFEQACLETLASHDWRGNARELENLVVRALVLAKSELLTVDVLPPALRAPGDPPRPGLGGGELASAPLAEARETFERSYLESVLRLAGGSVAEAARRAGVDASNLRRSLKRLEIDPKQFGK